MTLDLWWAIPGVLAGMSHPFLNPRRYDPPSSPLDAYPDELPALWQTGIRAVVCLLNMPGAAPAYTGAGFAFHCLPIPDGHAPSLSEFHQFLTFFTAQRALGHPVAVHCEAGIGRTGTLLAGVLVTEGATPEAAVAHVRAARPGAVETIRQFHFLRELALS